MSEPDIGGRAPLPIDVVAGETYWWCACGRSRSQPFCDGSHKPTDFTPMEWTAPATKRVFFCTCKRTKTMPLCDGSHLKL
ncbi:MAG TPA: CDGSH iron-sulfur domain-containing protein [Pseudolabrys sp.]|jgi:CDGSH-type Zn-finger protein